MVPVQVGDFLHYKSVERGISENTREGYRRSLCDFCSFLGEGHDPARAEERDLHEYISSCYARHLKASTIANRTSALREFFKFLQIEGLIERNPMDRIESPKRGRRLPRYLSEQEAYKFLRNEAESRLRLTILRVARGLRDQAILETLYAGGLRESELTSAKTADLDFGRGCLIVFGKGSKERQVPLGSPALAALGAYLGPTGRPVLDSEITPSLTT